MTYRRAENKDIFRIIEFRKILLEREDDDSLDESLSAYFNDSLNDGSLIAWVAEEENLIVSAVCLSICSLVPRFDNPSGKVAYMTNVYTVPNHRRMGIASRLIHKASDDAAAQGVKKILLHSSDEAASFYKNLGFSEGVNYFDMKI